MSSYNKFAQIYDELMNDFDYHMWANYIEEIFKNNNKTPNSILEMACGTGSLTYELGSKGYKVTGFDLSDEMLAIAYKKLNPLKNVRVLNQDMIEFNLNKKYDAVVSICDSINYILYEDDLLQVFENVYSHLNNDGIFIFDINSYYKLNTILGNNIFVEDRKDVFYTWQNQFDNDENICDFFLTFFVKDEENTFIRFDEEHSERAYKIEEVVDLLNRVGFRDVKYFESFSFDDVNCKTERINFVVMK